VPLRDAVEQRPYPDLGVNLFDIGWAEVLPIVGQFGSTFAWWRDKLSSKQKYISSVTGGAPESDVSFKAAHYYGNKVTGEKYDLSMRDTIIMHKNCSLNEILVHDSINNNCFCFHSLI
jgi:hypothetical protein